MTYGATSRADDEVSHGAVEGGGAQPGLRLYPATGIDPSVRSLVGAVRRSLIS